MAALREIRFRVNGLPPAKNEAISMLSAGHPHTPRVVELLKEARRAAAEREFEPFGRNEPIGLEVVLYAPSESDPWDATNYLGGIADVLEDKSKRGSLIAHLGELREVFLYWNDRQIREVHYRRQYDSVSNYSIRLWNLP